jgi:hypothetical protein
MGDCIHLGVDTRHKQLTDCMVRWTGNSFVGAGASRLLVQRNERAMSWYIVARAGLTNSNKYISC